MKKKENEVSGQQVKTWICSVCGYECDGPEPPEKCPRCGVDAMYFDPVADVGDD
ncbi:MAG: hypothetical protein MJZ17_00755 [Bacteroidales bacterium]|nr:hypothetical protein [Bacteroidales bacterium]